jgi:hypothetical protein
MDTTSPDTVLNCTDVLLMPALLGPSASSCKLSTAAVAANPSIVPEVHVTSRATNNVSIAENLRWRAVLPRIHSLLYLMQLQVWLALRALLRTQIVLRALRGVLILS